MTENTTTTTDEVVEELLRKAVDPSKLQRTKNHPLRKHGEARPAPATCQDVLALDPPRGHTHPQKGTTA